MKKLFYFILALVFSYSIGFGQSGGDGSVDNPYQIATYADLQWLQGASSEWDKNFVQTADINAAATATDGWSGIGNQSVVFSGSYDGGGYTIDSLTISSPGYIAFIQKTSSTTVIKNLGLTNVNITLTGGNNGYTAALIAQMAGGTVENCYSTGNLISSTDRLYYNYGGLIGRIDAGSTVSDSYSEVNISNADSSENVGGFVGYNNGGVITNCHATGTIDGGGAAGGFVGTNTNSGDISKCYGTGSIAASSSSAGGFAGYNYNSTISECYSLGNVSGTYRVGGFIGYNRKAGASISNCYSFGNVTGNVGGHVGGFCGRNYDSATIEDCYVAGTSNDKGFVGRSYTGTPVVSACFFDSTISKAADDYAVAKTTEEMQTDSTFANAGWDLDGIWKVEGNYPNLRNNENPALNPKPIFSVPAGSGTEDDPYQIETLENLAWVTQNAGSWIKNFVQTADIDASETATWDSEDDDGDGNRFNDPNDLTTEGSNDGWMPIGGEFRGVYDGDGHVIDGLTMNDSTDNLGFFNTVTKATIKNLGLTNVNITGLSYLGGLAGVSYGNSVDNCYVTGKITSDNAHMRVGGLIGFAGGGDIDHVISNCYTDVEIVGGGNFSGGFIGNIKKAQSATITNCFALGNTSGNIEIGGFIGKLEASGPIRVDNCYSTGNAVGVGYGGGFVGDIRNDVKISNSYSLGNISEPEGEHSKKMGGFVGVIVDATVENSYSTGLITSTYLDSNDVAHDNLKNGFASYQHGTVTACFFDKETSNRDSSVTAIGKTTAEMQTESTFSDAGWDLTSVWKVEGNYPNLINNPNPDLEPVEKTEKIVGQWDFNDPNYLAKATVGDDLEIFGNPTAAEGPIEGIGAILVGEDDYLKAVTNIAPRDTNKYVNYYSYQIDLKMDELGWNSLLQTDLTNSIDGRLFVGSSGQVGKGTFGYSANGVINAGQWHRLIMAVAENPDSNNLAINLYVDGVHVLEGKPQSVDGSFTLRDSVFFLRDDGSERKPTYVSKIALYNYAIDSLEAKELGTPFQKEEVQDPLPRGKELIANYGFNDGLNGWLFNNTDTLAHATYELDKGSVINGPNSVKVHMDTCAGGTPSGRIALYTPVPIEEGQEYYITFKIKATKSVPLWKLYWVFYSSMENGEYYNPVGGWGVTSWAMEKADSVYKFELNYTPDFTNPETYFSIDFGYFATGPVDFWLDDIHIIKLDESKSKSLAFNLSDTRNQYVIAEDTLNFGLDSTWTMEGWFKFANFDAPGGENHLMRLGGQLFVDSEKHLKVKTDDYVAGTTELEKDKWYHIAYVRTPENVIVYLDGVKEIVAAGADAGAEADRFLIGAYNTTSTDYNFAGVLDEIRLWSVARTQAEINATKEVELSGTEDSLVIYYNFNEQRGNTVIDEAGGDNNGELVNMDDTNWSEDNPFDRPMPPDELPLPNGRDLITNNYFNDGLTGWDLNLAVQSSATLALDNSGALESEKSAKVHVNTVFNDDDWKIQFRQLELDTAIIAGHSYHIQYRIKASKDVSGINSVIQRNHGDFGNVYSKEISLLADSAISVVDTFICTETDDKVELAFNLGTISVADIDIWFDAIHLIDLGELSDVEEQRVIPAVFSLSQNYPNPFNPTTTINFSIPIAGKTTLIVYNVLGQKVATLVDSELPAGIYKYKFDASRFASGVYFYQLRSKNFNKIKKMMLIK